MNRRERISRLETLVGEVSKSLAACRAQNKKLSQQAAHLDAQCKSLLQEKRALESHARRSAVIRDRLEKTVKKIDRILEAAA